MTRRIKNYTDEFKSEAIKLALNSLSVTRVAKDLGIPEATLHGWVNKAKASGSVTASPGTVVNNVNISEIIEQNQELKKRVARLEQEKAILKKAATYFATELL